MDEDPSKIGKNIYINRNSCLYEEYLNEKIARLKDCNERMQRDL